MTARPIFIGGTASHVGKSWVATALCRFLARSGARVAPFKAQNMSNNSAVTDEGCEIGRAQAAQAEACGLRPHADMNPILLKPTGRLGSQIVLNGRPWRNLTAVEYPRHFDYLLEQVLSAYARLAARFDYIVIEGAGSVAELNLQRFDLVNLGLAARLGAPAILVADIDRGGIFASIIGTFQLLGPVERPLVRSFLVNRFRGDAALFQEGVRILEERTGRPCLGVFPYASGIALDPEDAVSLDQPGKPRPRSARVAIVRLPHISNFTDFRLLPDAVYVSAPVDDHFDAVFLPGTKCAIEDTLWLRSAGLDRWIERQLRGGSRVIGVCGGFQMLGEEILDPGGVESPVPAVAGLGLLPVRTSLAARKTTRRVRARTPAGVGFEAYEIHMGVTEVPPDASPFAILDDGGVDGMRQGQVAGTYLHGAFENSGVLQEALGTAAPSMEGPGASYEGLADWFAAHVDLGVFEAEYAPRASEDPRPRRRHR